MRNKTVDDTAIAPIPVLIKANLASMLTAQRDIKQYNLAKKEMINNCNILIQDLTKKADAATNEKEKKHIEYLIDQITIHINTISSKKTPTTVKILNISNFYSGFSKNCYYPTLLAALQADNTSESVGSICVAIPEIFSIKAKDKNLKSQYEHVAMSALEVAYVLELYRRSLPQTDTNRIARVNGHLTAIATFVSAVKDAPNQPDPITSLTNAHNTYANFLKQDAASNAYKEKLPTRILYELTKVCVAAFALVAGMALGAIVGPFWGAAKALEIIEPEELDGTVASILIGGTMGLATGFFYGAYKGATEAYKATGEALTAPEIKDNKFYKKELLTLRKEQTSIPETPAEDDTLKFKL